MKLRSVLASCVGVLMLLSTACYEAPGSEAQRVTTATLKIKARLPRRLGGGTRYTDTARHGKPARRFALGARFTDESTRARSARGRLGARFMDEGLPETVDLSADAPVAGDQGMTGSCATYATGYSVMGWWANREGLAGAPYAPMYLYSTLVNGSCEEGTVVSDSLDLLQWAGIPSETSYQPMQRNLDCSVQPLDERTEASAAQHRISGYETLELSDPRSELKAYLAAGYPLVLGIMTYDNLMNADAERFVVGPPSQGEQPQGGHAIAAFAYDENGLWFLNSWSTSWGLEGWAQLSWEFLEGSTDAGPNLLSAHAITGLAAGD